MWINKKFIYFSGNQQSISSFIKIKKAEKLHNNEGKEKERARRRKGGEEKKEMAALLVLYNNSYFIL